ncbi:DUF3662 and FHA domain-containing protein [Scrofimicrobium sp. R131]|uniref:DUF3662 and FHA domain-containing protein n=1 Tax=Scrofimicrobium appendicitidis TaxID=3079930 RepID=A0AAU7V7U5_9ACTO
MSFFDRFENAVEKGVNSVFSRVFKSGLKPVDVSSALQRAADDGLLDVAEGQGITANEYLVKVSPSDFTTLGEDGLGALSAELAEDLTNYVSKQGYALLGPISVSFEGSDQEFTGNLEVVAQRRRGPAAPAAGAVASPDHPIIDIDGEKWLLTEPVTVIGRGSEADIQVNDSGVSRKHVEFRITESGVILTDLGSTNGTFVEGHRVDAATLVDGNQIVIGRTPIYFWTHPEDVSAQ